MSNRVIIRLSLNNDQGSALRNMLAPILEGAGLVRGAKTATYEGELDADELRDMLRRFWNTVHSYTGPAHLDHFWMYADRETDAEDAAEAA
jgi:hypothetical protein